MTGDHPAGEGPPGLGVPAQAGPAPEPSRFTAFRSAVFGASGPAAALDWHTGLRSLLLGLAIGAAALALLVPLVRTPHPASPPAMLARQLDLGTQPVSPDARRLAQAIVQRGDNGALPFVLIDKRQAQLLVFQPSGRLLGATPILLGYAPGDDSVAGIGQRPIEQVRPSERTTPAGRFVAEPGRNARGEDVVWVDYDAAVSMHRVRLTDPKERRLERLASPNAADRRISYGCINLPVAFFDTVVWPTLRTKGGVVYVLPEFKRMAQAFPGLVPPERVAQLEPRV